ncbi:MAG: MBL fold metallo-hydrolase [Gemmatimonadetes bacterium]|nr:MBL fold metallo-hydrolase [Gemmatimonadota bacterium]
MRAVRTLLAIALFAGPVAAQAPARNTLDIYFIDTEGGQATLFVTPSGESVMIDSGNPGARDLDRILATFADAGVRQLDHLVSTHFHVDHIGGLLELAKRIPIRHYVDHGPTVEPNEQVAGFQQAYAALYGKARRTVARPGDRLPIAGLDWRIVTAGGRAITAPIQRGAAANSRCATFQRKEMSVNDENAHSVGSVVTFGEFRTINLGDLLWNQDFDLACPTNKVGSIDLYITTHHGLATSGAPALVHAIGARVAVMNNGPRKGGAVQTFQTLHSAPGLEDLWQLHWSYAGGVEHNTPGVFIANLDEAAVIAAVLVPPAATPAAGSGQAGAGSPVAAPAQGPAPAATRPGVHNGPAYAIKVSARNDGSFTVTNTRNGFTKSYAARR